MAVTPSIYLLVLPLVFLAAVVDAIAGGGGLISLPAYTVAGLNYDFASAETKSLISTSTSPENISRLLMNT